MKQKSILTLVILCLITVGLALLSYFGIGGDHVLGVQNIKLGLDLQGGVNITFEADKESPSAEEMSTAVSLIQDRLDRKGWTEAEVSQQGNKRIRVDIPGVADAEDAVREIGQTAMLKFVGPDEEVILTGADVQSARKDVGATSQGGPSEPFVVLEFNENGKALFAEATSKFIGQQIAIVLDETPISSPVVNSAITEGNAIISGSFTAESAEELAALIRAGSLPFNLNILEMNNVGARLGADALSKGILSGFVGLGLVVLFMTIFYRLSGLVASWALVIYVLIDLIILSLLGVTLTLPGIAGIILSIGMAVDANVIIYERIKEETQLGKSLRAAVDHGFSRAFAPILDGNVTNIIGAVILNFLGTGPIKGFAQTLIIGNILAMFTAIVIVRIIMNSLVSLGVKKFSVLDYFRVREGEAKNA